VKFILAGFMAQRFKFSLLKSDQMVNYLLPFNHSQLRSLTAKLTHKASTLLHATVADNLKIGQALKILLI
jgi:hypothetical protein